MEIMMTKLLRRVENFRQLINAYLEGEREPPVEIDVDPFLFSLALKLLSLNPTERGDLTEHLLAITQEEMRLFNGIVTPISQTFIREALDILVVKTVTDINDNAFRYKKIAVNLSEYYAWQTADG